MLVYIQWTHRHKYTMQIKSSIFKLFSITWQQQIHWHDISLTHLSHCLIKVTQRMDENSCSSWDYNLAKSASYLCKNKRCDKACNLLWSCPHIMCAGSISHSGTAVLNVCSVWARTNIYCTGIQRHTKMWQMFHNLQLQSSHLKLSNTAIKPKRQTLTH